MRELIQCGQDKIAAQFWMTCAAKSFAPRLSALALEPLFRQRNADQFLVAYRMVPEPTARDKDMLWQLWGEQLNQLNDADTVLIFQQAIRPTWPVNDWRRLMPVLAKATSADRARGAIMKAIEKEKDQNQVKLLQELANQS